MIDSGKFLIVIVNNINKRILMIMCMVFVILCFMEGF